jgi:hypothetical protein
MSHILNNDIFRVDIFKMVPLFKIYDGYASSLYSGPFRKSAVLDSILRKGLLPVFVDGFNDILPHGPTLEISPSWNHGFFLGGNRSEFGRAPPFAE